MKVYFSPLEISASSAQEDVRYAMIRDLTLRDFEVSCPTVPVQDEDKLLDYDGLIADITIDSEATQEKMFTNLASKFGKEVLLYSVYRPLRAIEAYQAVDTVSVRQTSNKMMALQASYLFARVAMHDPTQPVPARLYSTDTSGTTLDTE